MPAQTRERNDGITPLTFDQFQGAQTATDRAGVPDEQAYWIDGFMPMALRRLRTLPGVGNNLFSAASGLTIICFYFYNIGNVPYAAVFLSDGSLIQVNTSNGAQTTILTAGTILTPGITNMGVAQYGQQYLITVANQTNGYWVWDGSLQYTAGGLSPGVILTSPGAGYASAPVVTASGGHGSGATFQAQISGGVVTNVIITNPGTGYLAGDSVSLAFTGGTVTGTGGTVTASMSHAAGGSGGSITVGWSVAVAGQIHNYIPYPTIVAAGSGYGSLVAASITNASLTNWQSGGQPGVGVFQTGGAITGVSLVPASGNPNNIWVVSGGNVHVGLPLVTNSNSIVTIVNFATIGTLSIGMLAFDTATPSLLPVGTSILAVAENGGHTRATATLSNPFTSPNSDSLSFISTAVLPSVSLTDTGFFYVGAVSVVTAGTGYGPNISIAASGGGSPQSQAVLKANLSGGATGSIVSVQIISGGVYGSSTPPSLTVSDSASLAAGTVQLMPFGIQGTAVATYAGHVWVFNGNVFNFTAPGSVNNFATSAGGGSDQSNNSYLKVGYTNAVNTNGFLFLLGDSSMDYISGVTTSGSVATTTFTQNNSDPEVGTPYPAAVTTFGENILIANATGIFISSGGTFQKISEPMDGVYNTVPATRFNANPFSGFQLSAAKATIFSKRLWMVLVPIVDPVSGRSVNKLLMFRDKKLWFASEQDLPLTFIQGQEINSIFTAWGTDGTNLFPLFNQPAVFNKTVQSKYYDEPGGIDWNKADSRFWSTWNAMSTVSTSFTLTMDGVGFDGSGNQVTNSASYSIAGPTTQGYFVSPPQSVGQQGVYTGFTIITQAADMTLLTVKIGVADVQDRT